MPTLPKRLRRPHPWLGLLLLGVILFAVDISKSPSEQLSPYFYRKGISVYQWAKPRCGFKASCRFKPSCSHYSAEAVKRYGFLEGVEMTIDRLGRCRTDIPLGTVDEVVEAKNKAD